jgi:hypothetical protein
MGTRICGIRLVVVDLLHCSTTDAAAISSPVPDDGTFHQGDIGSVDAGLASALGDFGWLFFAGRGSIPFSFRPQSLKLFFEFLKVLVG